MNKKIIFLLLLIISSELFSQGLVENVLTSNPVLVQKYNDLSQKFAYRSGGSITDTLELGTNGFLEDFSYQGPYPDTSFWLDNTVFVNADLPIAPITIGAATFDGVNANGYPYNFSAGAGTTGKADSLTSKPIDLNYPGDTSIYFSFFYQAGGRGDWPFSGDSLVLEFKYPVTGAWQHMWATKGLSSAPTDSNWKYVSIHVTNPGFLKNGFQFRFRNYATLSGTFDNWHVDYIYLNRTRTANDSINIVQDVAFVYNAPSLTNTYTEMPWRHYTPSFLKSNYSSTLRNNNNALVFGGFGYNIYDESNTLVGSYNGGAINYEKFSDIGYDTLSATRRPPLSAAPVNFNIPLLAARTKYRIETFLSASPNLIEENDTVKHLQDFNNYFSYDDGTAETSFGMAGYLHAQMAVKYTVTVSDTLRCVDIYFNPQLTNANLYTFLLKVWTVSGSGAPGTAIFTSSDSLYKPYYNQAGRNWFTRYYLEDPVYLSAGMSFFVGFDQNTTQPINIGVDKNTNSQNMAYYNTSGIWQHPPIAGSLMIHPVLGSAAEVVGIESPALSDNKVIIYPNPANDQLFLYSSNNTGSSLLSFSIMDMFGRIIRENTIGNSESVDVSGLANGVYFITIKSGRNFSTQKFIISR